MASVVATTEQLEPALVKISVDGEFFVDVLPSTMPVLGAPD